eukprot:g2857.t1
MTAVRRFAIWFTLLLEGYILARWPSYQVRASVWLMVFAGMLSGIFDANGTFLGIVVLMLNNLLTAAYGVLASKILDGNLKRDLGKEGVLCYSALISLCLMIPYEILFTDDFSRCADFLYDNDLGFGFYFFVFFSGIGGMLLNYTQYLAIEATSATTQSVAGCAKNAVVAYLGVLGVGGDYVFTWPNFLSLNLSIVATFWYTKAKLDEKARKGLPQSVAGSSSSGNIAKTTNALNRQGSRSTEQKGLLSNGGPTSFDRELIDDSASQHDNV